VLPVQPVCFIASDEELGAVGVWARVFFIIKLLPVDGFASGAVVVGEVASLTHELGDDAVEAAPFEAEAFLVGAEAAEILCFGGKGERQGMKAIRSAAKSVSIQGFEEFFWLFSY
uniref:Uncharacterized protein n=1 Tax=Bubo bubo TaxID=30461 RepID=A0A8C0FDN5_BUBBB